MRDINICYVHACCILYFHRAKFSKDVRHGLKYFCVFFSRLPRDKSIFGASRVSFTQALNILFGFSISKSIFMIFLNFLRNFEMFLLFKNLVKYLPNVLAKKDKKNHLQNHNKPKIGR